VPVGRIFGFLQLYGVAALRPMRRASLRHKRETAHLEAWLARAADILPKNYDLGVEILRCRRLVKGYSDTHARGLSKFDRAMAKAPKLVSREDGAQWMARLIAAALMDERARRSTASQRRSTLCRPDRVTRADSLCIFLLAKNSTCVAGAERDGEPCRRRRTWGNAVCDVWDRT
jgi:hypothetical protein